MPPIPRAQRTQTIPGVSGEVKRDVQSAGVVGAGISHLADQVGGIIADRAKEIKMQDEVTTSRDIKNQYDAAAFDYTKQQLGVFGKDASGLVEKGREYNKTLLENFTKDLKSQNVKNSVTDHIKGNGKHIDIVLSKHAAVQRKIYNQHVLKTTVSQISDEVYNGGSLDDGFTRLFGTVADQFTSGIISKVEGENELDVGAEILAKSHLKGILNDDPSSAIDLIESDFYKDYLPQEQLDVFVKKAKIIKADIEKQEVNNAEKLEESLEEKTKEIQEDNATEYTIELSKNGTIDVRDLEKDLATGKISRAFFNSIKSDMEGPSKDSSDEDELLKVEDSINEGTMTRPEILANKLIMAKDKTALLDKLKSSQDKVFNNTYNKGIDKLQASIITTGPMQALSAGEKERMVSAKDELYDRLKAGEKYKEIIDDMIPRYDSRPNKVKSLPVPSVYGRKPENTKDIVQARQDVLSKMTDGTIDITTVEGQGFAERELRLLKEYQDIFERMAVDGK